MNVVPATVLTYGRWMWPQAMTSASAPAGDPGEGGVGLVLVEVSVDPAGLPWTSGNRWPSASNRICGTSERSQALFAAFVWALVHANDRVAEGFLIGVDAGAAAAVAVESGAIIVVADDGRDRLSLEAFEHLVWPGPRIRRGRPGRNGRRRRRSPYRRGRLRAPAGWSGCRRSGRFGPYTFKWLEGQGQAFTGVGWRLRRAGPAHCGQLGRRSGEP